MVREIHEYVKKWEHRCYHEGIPDEAPKEIDDMVPSYRRIAIAILKNDAGHIGFSKPKSIYYNILKGIEIKNRQQ